MIVPSSALLLLAATCVNAQWVSQFKERQFPQEFYDGYNPLKHFGGNGPYSQRNSFGISRETPPQCEVDQVIGLFRHGERYPDPGTAEPMVAAYEKILASNITQFQGSLAFINTWSQVLDEPSFWAQESFEGPYSGLLTSYKRGIEYRDRYGHLWDGESAVPIFSSGWFRVIDSARQFGLGFFSYNYSSIAEINIIPEDGGQGANSLTPSCNANQNNVDFTPLSFPQFANAADRFNSENPGLNLNASDIFTLMAYAPFELNSRPFSPWVDAFTLDEWEAFGYLQDLSYFYTSGPGLNTSVPVGGVYANATLQLLLQGPEQAGSMYWSFVHDTDIVPALAALNLLVPSTPLPVDYIQHDSIYKSGDIVPMGGHLILERLNCNATNQYPAGISVRAVINEAVVPFEDCQNGPGFSCPLANYTQRLSSLPDYISVCEIPDDVPQTLTFFWDYNSTTTLNFQVGPIAFQEQLTTWDGQPTNFDDNDFAQ